MTDQAGQDRGQADGGDIRNDAADDDASDTDACARRDNDSRADDVHDRLHRDAATGDVFDQQRDDANMRRKGGHPDFSASPFDLLDDDEPGEQFIDQAGGIGARRKGGHPDFSASAFDLLDDDEPGEQFIDQAGGIGAGEIGVNGIGRIGAGGIGAGAETIVCAAELDERRIRRIATLRRSLYRSRSHAITAALAAAAVAVQLGWMTFRSLKAERRTAAALLALAATGCVAAALYFHRRALALHRQTKGAADERG